MSNWYTSELLLSLYDSKSTRRARIELKGGRNNRVYHLILGVSLPTSVIPERFNHFYNTLAQAKAAGKIWVEKGIKPGSSQSSGQGVGDGRH